MISYWQLLERDVEKSTQYKRGNYWKAKCIYCGKIIAYRTDKLKTKVCDCQKSRFENIKGQQFGYLVPFKFDEERSKREHKGYWFCHCLNCGSDTENSILAASLKSKNTLSCGCLRSKGELYIKNFLEKQNFSYKREYSFSDLISDKGKELRFDFAILKNDVLIGLIEYQGKQHYESRDFYGGEKQLQRTQLHDQMKQDYCEKNNIPLLCISYTNKNLEDLIQSFLNKYF